MASKRRMTAAEFEAVRPFLKISDDRITAAHHVLVGGKTLQVAANQFGWSRQTVWEAVNVVWLALQNYRASQRTTSNSGTLLPAGWEQVTIIAPSHLIDKFRSEIAVASPQPEKDPKKKE